MIYYILEGFNIVTQFDEKDPGFIALPRLEVGKKMSCVTQQVFEALMANQKLAPQDALTAMSIVDTRQDVPADDLLKPVAMDVKPVEEPIEGLGMKG